MIQNAATPRIVHRKCGGWLALSADSDPVKIGVLAPSHEEARTRFRVVREEWRALLASPTSGAASSATGSERASQP